MKIICSWCRHEGKTALMGEKPPIEDERETHGICAGHRNKVEALWQASIYAASYSETATERPSALIRWTGLLHVTKKMRP